MKKKIFNCFVFALTLFCTTLFLGACSFSTSKNESKYWFSTCDKSFIEYNFGLDENDNEIEDNFASSGTYWKMTSSRNETISIKLITDCSYFERVVLTVNGKVVKSNETDGIFQCVYNNLKLKKGDKLVFHAQYTNYAHTSSTPIKMLRFTINDMPISDIQEK